MSIYLRKAARLYLPLALLALAAGQASAGPTPKMTRVEAIQLFATAGFIIQGKTILDRCGRPARPRVSFDDLNGDGVAEAIFQDAGPCYAGTGHWIAILSHAPQGWRPVFEAEGQAGPLKTRTNGWVDLVWVGRGGRIVLHYSSGHYGFAAANAPLSPARPARPAIPAIPAIPAVPAVPARPAVPGAPSSTGVEVTVQIGEAPTEREDAIVRSLFASDFADARNTMHQELEYSVGHADLNGDGRTDLLVQYVNAGWCGTAGCTTFALLATPTGFGPNAIDLASNHGTLHVLPGMHRGMHDLRYDDAHYIFRWNGREYR